MELYLIIIFGLIQTYVVQLVKNSLKIQGIGAVGLNLLIGFLFAFGILNLFNNLDINTVFGVGSVLFTMSTIVYNIKKEYANS